VVAATAALIAAPAASASTTQVSLFQDDGAITANPGGALSTLRSLGVTEIRQFIFWSHVASGSRQPRNPSNPASYPAVNWAPYDNVVRAARQNGIAVEFDIVGPVPSWAEGSGPRNKGQEYKPNAADYGSFVKAVGTRYSGHYAGLPRVSRWSFWNEPNYIVSLSPESSARGSVINAAMYYRSLIDHGWGALRASGHGGDTTLFGEVAPHGYFHGDQQLVAPLTFIRALYCLDPGYHPLRGAIARGDGCPTTTSGTRTFRRDNPILFSAKGFAAHLYAQGTPPNGTLRVPDLDVGNDADLGRVGSLTTTLDKANRAYGSGTKLAIWNTEYGYQTRPPAPSSAHVVSPATAATYINWAEYISYKNPRIASYDQYLLTDPPISVSKFSSGLEFVDGTHKPEYDAYMLPLYMPRTSAKSPATLEVWGGARPAHFQGAGNVLIKYTPSGGSPTFTPVNLRNGYFDAHVKFTKSGTVQVQWNDNGTELFSRTQSVRIG
jgi:hypothetical protein